MHLSKIIQHMQLEIYPIYIMLLLLTFVILFDMFSIPNRTIERTVFCMFLYILLYLYLFYKL